MKQTRRIILFTIAWLAGALLLLLLAFSAGAVAARPANPPGECQAGEICYWLMHHDGATGADSTGWLLCDGGHFMVEINGADSLRLVCGDGLDEGAQGLKP